MAALPPTARATVRPPASIVFEIGIPAGCGTLLTDG
jgi:hypothetical protein